MLLLTLLIWLLPSILSAAENTSYDEQKLAVKKMFAEMELQAISEPFVGVTTNGQVQQGLFPLTATGVSTAPIVEAARNFLLTLTPTQKLRTQFSVQDPEWRRWFNVDNAIYVRQGISLRDMNEYQRKAAWRLMETSLSARGVQLSRDIMKTDQALREINNDAFSFDELLYFFTLMGTPSATEPWGWQIDGHHLVINYFVLGDQVVMTPTFLGAEPVNIQTGRYAGTMLLQDEQDLGLSLMQSLNEKQQKAARLGARKEHNNNRGEALKDNLVLDYAGIRATEFTDEQKAALLALIERFVGTMRDDHATVRMSEVSAHLDNTWFAWVGETINDAVFYYRIHSPVIMVEFDHQFPVGTRSFNAPEKPTRDHIHTVIRTPNGNDYGKDLLGQHLEQHEH
jgi:predicted nuclease of restriction endonuclease-like (RecB) superfamily